MIVFVKNYKIEHLEIKMFYNLSIMAKKWSGNSFLANFEKIKSETKTTLGINQFVEFSGSYCFFYTDYNDDMHFFFIQ